MSIDLPTQGWERDITRTMGQSESKGERKLTPEEVSFLFSKKCASQFSQIEVWSIKVGYVYECVGMRADVSRRFSGIWQTTMSL
jgi:hypothetical protein